MNTSPYRFTLRRSMVDRPRRPLGVTMVNPSTASEVFVSDAASNDNTIRSLIRIAEYNGFDGLVVTNLSPYKATDPVELVEAIRAGKDVFAAGDGSHIVEMARLCEVIVCAWGTAAGRHPALEARASAVRALLLEHKPVIHCFGRTKDGWPKHPLFLARETKIIPWATRGTA